LRLIKNTNATLKKRGLNSNQLATLVVYVSRSRILTMGSAWTKR